MRLRERFESFIRTFDGCEVVDELLHRQHLEGLKRADYLLQGRSIILEQKVLEGDPASKPQRFVDRLRQEGRVLFW